jgi:hypothetical protein
MCTFLLAFSSFDMFFWEKAEEPESPMKDAINLHSVCFLDLYEGFRCHQAGLDPVGGEPVWNWNYAFRNRGSHFIVRCSRLMAMYTHKPYMLKNTKNHNCVHSLLRKDEIVIYGQKIQREGGKRFYFLNTFPPE